jgi:hypothetical protein
MLLEFVLDFNEPCFIFVEDIEIDIEIERKVKKYKRKYLYKLTIYPGKSFLLGIKDSNPISTEIVENGIAMEAGFKTKQGYKALLNFKVVFSIDYFCNNYDFLINFFEH